MPVAIDEANDRCHSSSKMIGRFRNAAGVSLIPSFILRPCTEYVWVSLVGEPIVLRR